jgi:hypothetical protein
VLLFPDDAAIPPTNHVSEQAIRMSTIFRKVTNRFHSDGGRHLFAAVCSVVNTGALALSPEIAPQPVHGMGIEIRAR